MNQTTLTKQEAVTRSWFIASAKGKVLGPLAVRVATALMGRNKPTWTPHTDSGDFVVVTDVDDLVFTGRKTERKIYRFHTGYIGGLKEVPLGKLHSQRPEMVLELAVKRMLPKTVQGRHQLKRLKIYRGSTHKNISQVPKPLP